MPLGARRQNSQALSHVHEPRLQPPLTYNLPGGGHPPDTQMKQSRAGTDVHSGTFASVNVRPDPHRWRRQTTAPLWSLRPSPSGLIHSRSPTMPPMSTITSRSVTQAREPCGG
jgi:hypothetical protein